MPFFANCVASYSRYKLMHADMDFIRQRHNLGNRDLCSMFISSIPKPQSGKTVFFQWKQAGIISRGSYFSLSTFLHDLLEDMRQATTSPTTTLERRLKEKFVNCASYIESFWMSLIRALLNYTKKEVWRSTQIESREGLQSCFKCSDNETLF